MLFSILKSHRCALAWGIVLYLLDLSLPTGAVLISASTGDMHIHSKCFSSFLFSILFQDIFSFYSLRLLRRPTFILGSRL